MIYPTFGKHARKGVERVMMGVDGVIGSGTDARRSQKGASIIIIESLDPHPKTSRLSLK
jgi:hypothetical protein